MTNLKDEEISLDTHISSLMMGFESLLQKAKELAEQNAELSQQITEFRKLVSHVTTYLMCQFCHEDTT
jgi:fatty acid-binding protein DegV